MSLKLFKVSLIALMVLLQNSILGQEKINFETNIKPILTKHCVNCHQNGGIAPFALDNWSDVDARAIMIGAVTASKYMPPWRADTSFQHYKNENYLSKTEIEAGLELRMFKNKVNFDLTLFRKRTKDQIIAVSSPRSTGFSSRVVNAGEVENKGIELGITTTNIQTSNFKW